MAYTNPGFVNGSQPYLNAKNMNDIANTLEKVPVANGGTGATTAASARSNLGLNTAGINALVNGNPLPTANGGTGSSTLAGARSNLGLGSAALLASIHVMRTYNGADWMTENSISSGARTTLAAIGGTVEIYFGNESITFTDRPTGEESNYFHLIQFSSPTSQSSRKIQFFIPETGSAIYMRKTHGGTSTGWYKLTATAV